ncbi:MAG: YhcN/YlaJ family sporulation lipoprotein [Ectobacillus sp.]
MNKKIKLITTSLLVVGALTACNTESKDTAMERHKQKGAYDYGAENTSYYSYSGYPNAYGYVAKPRSVTDRYTDLDMNRVSYRDNRTDDNGNVRYSRINKEIHRNRTDVGYNYYNDRNFHGHIDNPYPTRNVTLNGYYTNADGATAETITNRVERMKEVADARTIVYGNKVLVAVKARDMNNTRGLEDRVRRTAMPYAKGRNIHVTMEDGLFNRVRDMSTRLRNGTMTNDMNTDLQNMFDSIRTDYNRMRD